MLIEKEFSNIDREEERVFSVLMDEEELRLYSEFLEEREYARAISDMEVTEEIAKRIPGFDRNYMPMSRSAQDLRINGGIVPLRVPETKWRKFKNNVLKKVGKKPDYYSKENFKRNI